MLEVYGSVWPGTNGYVDDIADKKKEVKSNGVISRKGQTISEKKVNDVENGAQALRDQTFATEFGQVRSTNYIFSMIISYSL